MRKKNQSNEFIKICFGYALVNLMKKQNFYDITISSICKEAGFGRTTYYRHFTNKKEELLLFLAHYLWEQYKQQHEEDVKKDEGMELLKHIYNHKEFFLLLHDQGLFHIIYEIFYNEFGLKKDEDPILKYAKSMFIGLYFGVIYEWILQGCLDTPKEISLKVQQGFTYALKQVSQS